MDYELFKERVEDSMNLIKINFFEISVSSIKELSKRDKEEGNKACVGENVGLEVGEGEASLQKELKTIKIQLSDVEKEKITFDKECRILKDEIVSGPLQYLMLHSLSPT